MLTDLSPNERAKYLCAAKAAEFVESGMKVGLGTGSTAYWLIKHLGREVRERDLKIKGVPTSKKQQSLLREKAFHLLRWIRLVG